MVGIPYQITVLDSGGNVVVSYLAPERSTEAIKEALRRAKEVNKVLPSEGFLKTVSPRWALRKSFLPTIF